MIRRCHPRGQIRIAQGLFTVSRARERVADDVRRRGIATPRCYASIFLLA